MLRFSAMRKISWALCFALLVLRVGGAHAHVHLHFDGAEPEHGVHLHVHTGAGAHAQTGEGHSPPVEIDVGVKAELLAKKPAGTFEAAAPLAAGLLLLLVGTGRTFVARRRRAPIRVLSIFAIRPLLRAPPLRASRRT